MTEAQDTDFLAEACEACGAEVGESCRFDCIGMASYIEGQPIVGESDPDLETEAKRALTGILSRLPLSGASFLKPVPLHGDCATDVWLGRVAVWMDDYRKAIASELEDLQGQSRKAMALQFEKDVVRQFLLGTPVSS